MATFRRILCPVDFSDVSRHAVDQAVAVARAYGSTVTALHVVPLMPYTDPFGGTPIIFMPQDIARTEQELKAFVTDEAGSEPIRTAVLQGNPVTTIIEQAEALPADLIVLGTHGRGGFEHLMIGSVTERVLRRADCPVLTVPRRAPDAVPVGPVVFRRILCGLDLSPASEKALAYAQSLASETGAELTIMHVVEPAAVYEPVLAGGSSAQLAHSRDVVQARISAIAPGAATVVTMGKPYREILQHAADSHSDLIVIGVHSGFADRLHLGSTTNHIVREAVCPVLSLRG